MFLSVLITREAQALTLQFNHPQAPAKPISPKPTSKRAVALAEPTSSSADLKVEQTLRPGCLEDYVGQSALKASLAMAIEAAKTRGEPLDHSLFYGPPGLGKTSLALVLAQQMQAPIHITSAPALERPRDLVGLLMALEPGALLFIDEIHRLSKVAEEILYPAMEDFALDRMVGKGASARVLRVPLPRFTLIGATTKAGSLSNPLRDRFGMLYRLSFYQPEELAQIILRSAGILNVGLEPEAALLLAQRSRATPRIANRLLRRVRDLAQIKASKAKTVTQAMVCLATAKEALALFELDHLGLDPTDRQMLQLMATTYNGGPVGLEAVASVLGEDARTLEDVYEPFLLQSGLIHRSPRGRMLTAKAYEHLGLAVPTRLKEEASEAAIQSRLFE